MKFAELLSHYRNKKGLTKTALAQKAQVSLTYIKLMEDGERFPSPEKFEKLVRALSLSNDDKKKFLQAAFEEKNSNDYAYAKAAGNLELHAPQEEYKDLSETNTKIKKVPVISWVKANAFDDINDPLPPGTADEWVYTTERGRSMFALKVSNDCMSPEFNEGDIIIIRPDISPENGKFVVVKDSKSNKATFKQYKKYGDNIILHPINSRYPDIVLDHDDRYQIIGVVVEKVKKY